MELKQIQYFTEVVKHGSFSKAAENLHLSQPNISKIVKNLEEELNAKLLIRTTRKFELTDTGKLLYQCGQQIAQSVQNFYQEFDDITNSKMGYVKMGIFSTLGTDVFSEIMSLFHKEYPGITVQFVEDGALNLKKMLIHGDIDLVVMPIPIEEEFECIPFMSGDLRLLVHQNHRFSSYEAVSWEELRNESFIIFREGFKVHELIIEECKRGGFQPKIICETSQINFIMDMVAFNHGIAILPQRYQKEIDKSERGVKIIPLMNPQVKWQVGIAWKKGSYISHATKTWLEFLGNTLKVVSGEVQ
ncbi:LysR family transcriptional regulator [Bacillus sp. UNC438CL73TsuS30]|uniref:LysR family transcriptional regulator n=1 Tax=Bacillus sp. UNC438CL73TsuS30 TaxID=1340434 RepID=UPI00047A7721|nr:LysR family transcriptional regulator [Bacillus sp. UNC438CL73TsuS30]